VQSLPASSASSSTLCRLPSGSRLRLAAGRRRVGSLQAWSASSSTSCWPQSGSRLRLGASSRQWELQGLVPSGKALDQCDENTKNMYRMFVNLPAEVTTQGMSMIHGEFSKFFRTDYFNGESNKTGGPLAILRGIQQCLARFKIVVFGLLTSYQDW
jgi:hypothetical protein